MKKWADFKIFVFRFERFLEGPEGVMGACSDVKELIVFFLAPKGGPRVKGHPWPGPTGAEALGSPGG